MKFLGLCCAAYIGVAAVAFPGAYAGVLSQFALVFALSLPPVFAVIAGVVGFVDNPAAPLRGARRRLGQMPWRAAKIILTFILCVAAYSTFKTNIPNLVPHHADPWLADWDEFLHGGAPWRLLHALPQRPTSAIVDFFYSIVWFAQWFGVLLLVAMWEGRERKRYLWALAFTTLVVGTLMAVIFSSVGPIFYDRFYGGDRFAELVSALEAGDGPRSVPRFARYLLASYDDNVAAFGTGISAMPSMHVAIATLNALFLGCRERSLGVPAWIFVAIIQFGSVYTGWHYAIDGYVSIAIVMAIWWLTGLFVLKTKPVARVLVKPAVARTSAPNRPAKPLAPAAPKLLNS
ncbi:phosphatase PAP2 family protein [Mesorhizobium sp. IMUNJ 23232]|uniref:phosphatase PAP2 family protein n=1 Tax=Mesorhizobium sp. IMUNJ 23232 TaxID=3376064 RepID=UPI0037A27850